MSKFISIEGIEGTGKSTAVKSICAFLEESDTAYTLTREPGGTPIAEAVRDVLLAHHEEPMASDTELLLMFAGRSQNIANVIKPALSAGRWVVCDRFTDASFAYQGGGREINLSRIDDLANWVQGDLWPDVTILLDAPVEVGLSRMHSRGALDRMESEGIAFFERAREVYLQRAKAEPNRFHIVDASQSMDAVAADIRAILTGLL